MFFVGNYYTFQAIYFTYLYINMELVEGIARLIGLGVDAI